MIPRWVVIEEEMRKEERGQEMNLFPDTSVFSVTFITDSYWRWNTKWSFRYIMNISCVSADVENWQSHSQSDLRGNEGSWSHLPPLTAAVSRLLSVSLYQARKRHIYTSRKENWTPVAPMQKDIFINVLFSDHLWPSLVYHIYIEVISHFPSFIILCIIKPPPPNC